MATRYKLTDQDGYTRRGQSNETLWKIGEWVEATGNPRQDLCSDGWIHWYSHPLLAVLMNPIHACIKNPRLWEIETGGEEKTDHELKGGSRRVRSIKELPVPRVTTAQLVRVAILCGKKVYKDVKWLQWADGWLSGKDKSARAARDAAAACAAYAAADAAYAARDAAAACAAACAAYAAADAACAAYAAADAARDAAAACADTTIDLVTLIQQAIEEEGTC